MSSSLFRILVAVLATLAMRSAMAATTTGDAGVLLTRDEALALAFPECSVAGESQAMTKEDLERVEELAGTPHGRRLVRRHVGLDADGEVVGTAYIDVHRVRTLRESLMIVVDPKGQIARIEILAFAEPKAYMARAGWLSQFVGHDLDEELSLKGSIRGIAGATLTARATTDAVRRVLAIHQVIEEREASSPPVQESSRKTGEASGRHGSDGAVRREPPVEPSTPPSVR